MLDNITNEFIMELDTLITNTWTTYVSPILVDNKVICGIAIRVPQEEVDILFAKYFTDYIDESFSIIVAKNGESFDVSYFYKDTEFAPQFNIETVEEIDKDKYNIRYLFECAIQQDNANPILDLKDN